MANRPSLERSNLREERLNIRSTYLSEADQMSGRADRAGLLLHSWSSDVPHCSIQARNRVRACCASAPERNTTVTGMCILNEFFFRGRHLYYGLYSTGSVDVHDTMYHFLPTVLCYPRIGRR